MTEDYPSRDAITTLKLEWFKKGIEASTYAYRQEYDNMSGDVFCTNLGVRLLEAADKGLIGPLKKEEA